MPRVLDEKISAVRRESEERDAQRRAEALGLPYLDFRNTPVEIDSLKHLSESEAIKSLVVPYRVQKNNLFIAVYDSKNIETGKVIEGLRNKNFQVEVSITSKSGLEYAWKNYEKIPKEEHKIEGSVDVSDFLYENLKSKISKFSDVTREIEALDPRTVKTENILSVILGSAILSRASDIHFEPEEKNVRVRYRIDGVLHDATKNFSSELYHFIVSRIKLLSKLKINVSNESQNGRFTILSGGREIEIRTSIVPSEFAETIVLRILYAEALSMSLSDLGFRMDDLKIIEDELKQPNGMILNTGPTGSGKTTTLYVFLKSKAKPEVKIITIEDPIEYRLEGVEQTQVDAKRGYDFSDALKASLRQDPDIILVGEINNKETAETALQAALTGHLVFSTVHANNAPAAIPRLVDLGVKPVGIGPGVNLIIAQRLARKLCIDCKVPQKITKELEGKIKKFFKKLDSKVVKPIEKDIKIFNSKGCDKCGGFGYRGRIGLFELFLVDEKVGSVINENASEADLTKLAKEQGMTTVQEDGILKALNGITSLEEVEAITGPLKW